MTTDELIEEILKHRDEVRIFRDEDDGTWFADGVRRDPATGTPMKVSDVLQYYGHTLEAALEGLMRMVISVRINEGAK